MTIKTTHDAKFTSETKKPLLNFCIFCMYEPKKDTLLCTFKNYNKFVLQSENKFIFYRFFLSFKPNNISI